MEATFGCVQGQWWAYLKKHFANARELQRLWSACQVIGIALQSARLGPLLEHRMLAQNMGTAYHLVFRGITVRNCIADVTLAIYKRKDIRALRSSNKLGKIGGNADDNVEVAAGTLKLECGDAAFETYMRTSNTPNWMLAADSHGSMMREKGRIPCYHVAFETIPDGAKIHRQRVVQMLREYKICDVQEDGKIVSYSRDRTT